MMDAMWVRLAVTDMGIGMDAATRARVFEPFFTTKPRGRGTGLGLSAVHGMMLQSNGRADIDSRPGHGTTVVLEFPFALEPLSAPVTVPPVVAVRGGATILVAEDDDGTRATVARMLGHLGYSVILAPDGLQAQRLLEQHGTSVDLLLTDVIMPGLTGPALVARAREHRPSLPVLFMSGYPEESLEAVPWLRPRHRLPWPSPSPVPISRAASRTSWGPRRRRSATTPDALPPRQAAGTGKRPSTER